MSFFDYTVTALAAEKPFEGFGRGVKAKALEQFAKKNNEQYGEPVNIGWNFTKFLVNRAGELVARFEPTADMDEVEKAIKAQL